MFSRPSEQQRIPEWDGNSVGWLKYQREVKWFVSGLNHKERSYSVGRLVPGLSGPARQLVLKWDALDFEVEGGWQLFLEKTDASALIKKALVDTNARMDTLPTSQEDLMSASPSCS